MKKPKPKGYWQVKKHVLDEAIKHQSITEWHKASSTSCDSARKNGWLDEATSHMKVKKRPSGYWTKERVLADAKQYTQRLKWQKQSGSAYVTGRRKGWLDEATAHMEVLQKPAGYWQVKKHVLGEARKYKSITEWQKASSASNVSARQNGWFDEATAHMVPAQKPSGYWHLKENVLKDAKQYSTKV